MNRVRDSGKVRASDDVLASADARGTRPARGLASWAARALDAGPFGTEIRGPQTLGTGSVVRKVRASDDALASADARGTRPARGLAGWEARALDAGPFGTEIRGPQIHGTGSVGRGRFVGRKVRASDDVLASADARGTRPARGLAGWEARALDAGPCGTEIRGPQTLGTGSVVRGGFVGRGRFVGRKVRASDDVLASADARGTRPAPGLASWAARALDAGPFGTEIRGKFVPRMVSSLGLDASICSWSDT